MTSTVIRPECEVAAHVAVADALVAWDELETGCTRLFEGLGEALGFQVGVLWVPRGERLTPRFFWQREDLCLPEFKMMTLTTRLPRGMEVSGRAWQLLQLSTRGASNGPLPPRMRAALSAGLLGAIALPAIWSREVIAVLELDGEQEMPVDERLARSLTAIGCVLGYFLAHRRGELDKPVLTNRQIEILQLAAGGLSAAEIAAQLVLSRATVKAHFEQMYARLGVTNRVEAVAEAIRLGMIQ